MSTFRRLISGDRSEKRPESQKKDRCHWCNRSYGRHAKHCPFLLVIEAVALSVEDRAAWDKGWTAGFNGEPNPDPADSIAGFGHMAGDEARRKLME